ncbi:hypothetical protein [Tengunoibacter tsumagoiensis]|uniref:Uncharacterized protein n=1 Tax=Tengunoibacter tsumagoiensis TaxID=2014871 RepID=A0A402A3B4_9CHLR|nr:hypothetical protein [Tengunoibacter tsumagoiensis]GCE13481.1 hypothetical protein KTT_33400 [Tengunoibacter tsumagoiensis]
MSTQSDRTLGYLRTCMDRRFVEATRKAFEQATGLAATDYWHESYAGGSAVAPASTVGEVYSVAHGAQIFGWQAHINNCGGQPGVSDDDIARRLDAVVAKMKETYPHGRHFRILAGLEGIDIQEA